MTREAIAQAETQVAPTTRVTEGLLQRKCACGKHTGGGGECGECRNKKLLQRRVIGHTDPATVPPIVHQVLRSPGRPLDAPVRASMEASFGHEFSHVRIHTDSRAAASAQAVYALAYTAGNDIVFGPGQYDPNTRRGKHLLAHELTHVLQQGSDGSNPQAKLAVSPSTDVSEQEADRTADAIVNGIGSIPTTFLNVRSAVQRAGDPAAIPPGFPCPTDLTTGRPAGTDVLFTVGDATITPAHTALLTTFRASWLAAGGTDDILVHGYASTAGDQEPNWTLSCDRAEAVRAELVRLGIPAVRISVVAHGESTDFGASLAANQHAVVSTSAAGPIPLPIVTGTLTAQDNFAGRSTTRFGVGETIDLSFFSLPPRPAADFGGLEWHLVSGGGTLAPGLIPADGTATYTAPATAGAVQLELRVASGATAGRVISSHTISIVIPSAVRITAVPGTAPTFTPGGTIAAGTWGAGFLGDVFVDPKDVSFRGVVFGEGTVAGVVTPSGSFLSVLSGRVHPVNTFGPGHAGNATTGTPVSPPRDQISGSGVPPLGSLLGMPICGASDFLWAIPWEFSVAGGARTPFAGGFTANHHMTSTFFCNATIEKAGAGPFCRRIDGTTC